MIQKILILGATSSIARETAALFAARGHHLYLASRDIEELARIATDLKIRYNVPVYQGWFDSEEFNTHPSFLQQVLETKAEI